MTRVQASYRRAQPHVPEIVADSGIRMDELSNVMNQMKTAKLGNNVMYLINSRVTAA